MSVSFKNIAVVCNPTNENRSALKIGDEIAKTLSSKNIRHSLFTTYWPEVMDEYSEAWIVGGDGTLNFFINKYIDIKIPLALFKGGSGNDFHWMLHGEIEVNEQIEKLLTSQPTLIDAGMCNERLFLNGVGIGFDGAIVKDMLGKKKLAGKASYLLSILKNILKYNEQQCSIKTDDEDLVKETFLISVANGIRYGGGFKVAPNASVNDGVLDVNIIERIPPLKRLRYLPVIEEGKHLSLPFVTYKQAKNITIESSKNLPCHIDGEFFETNSFIITCLPNRFLFLR